MDKDEIIQELAKHLQSALRVIAEDKEDEFIDEDGYEMPRECGGNYSCSTFSAVFGEYDFDWREAEATLKKIGVRV